MAEQGEADIPLTIQLPEPIHPHSGAAQAVSPPEKLSTIKNLRQQPLKVGDTWYIVARRWYRRWEKACTGEVDKEGAVEESALGPVDNAPLLDKDDNITSTLMEGIDVEFVPKDVWELFVAWYVDGGSLASKFSLNPYLRQVWRICPSAASQGDRARITKADHY
jgi:ubiquitin carboxyl-terminal hydrolase 4/11/15